MKKSHSKSMVVRVDGVEFLVEIRVSPLKELP